MTSALSDKTAAVFAFAAYHQLTSGEIVKEVVLQDGSGHAADPEAVDALAEAGLITRSGDRAVFTDAGMARLAKTIEAVRTVG